VTRAPCTVVNTHDHFDHCYGNLAFRSDEASDVAVWAQQRADVASEEQRRNVVAWLRSSGSAGMADEIASLRLVAPTHRVTDRTRLDVGGRAVQLVHPGRGHTDHDLVVHVPDASVTFAGDLVEEGNDPAMEDADPLAWPATLGALLAEAQPVVVPGHGAVVDRAFVAAQRDVLADLAEVARRLPDDADDAALARAARGLPLREATCLTAFRRVLGRPHLPG
jgi:glyoxylase-like metal-dependent hydrolase (beta-lactamase superfamily II)